MNNRIKNKNDRAAQVKQLILGTNKHYPNGSQSLSVGGATFTVTALTQLMQDFVDQRTAVETAKAATKTKIPRRTNPYPFSARDHSRVRDGAPGNVRQLADVLADFGLTPPKALVPLTAEKKAVAAAKRNATRAARHTMGSNQKKDVKGAVHATLVVTPADGTTPSVNLAGMRRAASRRPSRRRPHRADRQRAGRRHDPARVSARSS